MKDLSFETFDPQSNQQYSRHHFNQLSDCYLYDFWTHDAIIHFVNWMRNEHKNEEELNAKLSTKLFWKTEQYYFINFIEDWLEQNAR